MLRVKVISTSASIEAYREQRTRQYIQGIESVNHLENTLREKGVDFSHVVLECVQKQGTNWPSKIPVFCFPDSRHHHNKGVSEMLALKWFLETLDPDPDRLIVKHTGRYTFTGNTFAKKILEAFDLGLEAVTKTPVHNSVFLGCIAMTERLWTDFLSQLDYGNCESVKSSIETEIHSFLRSCNKKEVEVIEMSAFINNEPRETKL